MRNVMIMTDSGIEVPYQCDGNIYPKFKKFTKTIFKEKGVVECFPFLNLIKEYYINVDPNSPILEELNAINDCFNIWIIFNRIENDPKPWQINNFLSKLFNADIYAENICMFVSQDELNNGAIDVTESEYERFTNTIIDICKIALQKQTKEYLDKLKLFICDNDIITLSGEDVIYFQDEYFGKKQSSNFTELIELKDDNIILRKSGIILNLEDNNAELYFAQSFSDDNIFKEILC